MLQNLETYGIMSKEDFMIKLELMNMIFDSLAGCDSDKIIVELIFCLCSGDNMFTYSSLTS